MTDTSPEKQLETAVTLIASVTASLESLSEWADYTEAHDIERKVDREKLRQAVKMEYKLEIMNEESPVADSQSNGEVENAVQRCTKQIRTVKCGLEARLGKRLPKDSPLFPWLIRNAGATINSSKLVRMDTRHIGG